MKLVRDCGLTLFFFTIFLLTLVGQSLVGLADVNDELIQHGSDPVTYWAFVTSSDFIVDVAENWQSEFLQFFLFILATVWLVQRGSPESKKPGSQGLGSDEEQRVGTFAQPDSPAWAKVSGIRRWVFSNSLLIVMGTIFFLELAGSVAGWQNLRESRKSPRWERCLHLG